MTRDVYRLWAVWEDRPETTKACAVRLAGMIEGLAALHPAFARWNKKGDTREEADAPFCAMPPRIDELTEIFEEGRQYTDHPRMLMPDLGYWASAWNGLENAYGVSLTLNVGADRKSRTLSNHVELNFGYAQPGNEDLVSAKAMRQVLLAVAGAWDAEWAVIDSMSYKGRLENSAGHYLRPWGGWITYLSPLYAQHFTPPPAVIVEPASFGGLLMLATEEPFAADNPAHVAAADAIQAALEVMRTAAAAPSST